ncbi:MAG: hypothetical protein EGQ63_08035, partial [Clostridiales bacterium]|nr:hypothetical protein [Clostridiales bacterium]
NYTYLSDISYDKDKSFAASGHSIHLDENDSNQMITLKVNEKSQPYIKGLCAWATSEIVYDLKDYDYDYFTADLGVDISEQSTYFNTGVRFYIYTSDDGEEWTEKYNSSTFYGWSEAKSVKVDIKNAKYLKLTNIPYSMIAKISSCFTTILNKYRKAERVPASMLSQIACRSPSCSLAANSNCPTASYNS